MTVQGDYARCIGRELATVRDQLLAYPDTASIWAVPTGLPNSAGTLTLHIAGNLRFFIGGKLGGSGYVRDRDAEFSLRGVERDDLVRQIEAAADEVTRALATLDDSQLDEPFPVEVGGVRLPTSRFIGHLATHLAYHLGQMDYHRRIVTGMNTSVGGIAAAALADR
ncbi:MAG: DinB superfamily protein [Gemmatimonadetes bacterium]|nr:MAG: DinB superfamily protein [Gemmatimonadota bacterium]PHX96431.1 MAG: DinB superfamily protein [Gemmatimonadota bacterium]